MRQLLYIFLINFCCIHYMWADSNRYTSESVLAQGKWVKISVDTTAIYKLSYNQLREMGFSNPEKVSVHGYGGWPLEESFTDYSNTYIDDLPATAVYRGSDYILFYGRGDVKWQYNSYSQTFTHIRNPYSTLGYYFLTDATEPKEIETLSSANITSQVFTTFDDYFLHEQELYSPNESGRELFGESFVVTKERDITTKNIQGITNNTGRADFRFIGRPSSATSATLYINNEAITSAYISLTNSQQNDSYYTAKAVEGTSTWEGEKNETIRLKVSYNYSGNDSRAYLDYIRLQFKRTLQPYGAYTFFRNIESIHQPSRFIVQNANAQTIILDVTDGLNPKKIETQLNGSELSFIIPAGDLREFVIVQPEKVFPSPAVVKEIKNQNLHGLSQTDMVILSSTSFTSQANRLAEAHQEKDGLSVIVVDPETIYNEFSSGTPDATAYRRFMKMFYDRGKENGNSPQYLLLFGDGSYDNRFLTTNWRQNMILQDRMLLTYQTEESLTSYSYPPDNYFGMLEDNSGNRIADDQLCLGIGRIPVRSLPEATDVVTKIINYMFNEELDGWKNRLCFMADDGNPSDSFTIKHMEEADVMADYMETNHPAYNVTKLYYDRYKKDNSGGSGRYKDVEEILNGLFDSGLFLFNYTGHGSTSSLSDEKVIENSDILKYSFPKLPFWITATCDFTRFDHTETSAGENVFLNAKSGGIGLFTTTRVAYVDNASMNAINALFIKHLFEKENGVYPTLGDVMRRTYNDPGYIAPQGRTIETKLGYTLIGDPALRLTYPEYNIEITAINGEAVSDEPVTFRASETITVEGQILNSSGNPVNDFNGPIYPTVLDSRDEVTTLDNNQTGTSFNYQDYLGTIFSGKDLIENGKFSFTFTVPWDIFYSNKNGKKSLYAYDQEKGIEANGHYDNYLVGDTYPNPNNDNEGPEILSLYLNDSTFTDGGKVNSTPFLYVHVWDESGINITGTGLGHEITLIIDNQANRNYNLNGYYQSIPGKTGEGTVFFLIPELSTGIHTAEFKIWDVLNNSTTYEFTFEVVEGLKPDISEVIAAPSPAREQVTFRIYHNRPASEVDITLMVYDMTGKLQWKHEETGSSNYSEPYKVTWDLTNNQGSRVRPGVYIYQAAIRSGESKEATKARKLIILAQ